MIRAFACMYGNKNAARAAYIYVEAAVCMHVCTLCTRPHDNSDNERIKIRPAERGGADGALLSSRIVGAYL